MSRKENVKNSRKSKRKTTILNATSVTLISYLILHLSVSTSSKLKSPNSDYVTLIFNNVQFSIFNSQNFLYFLRLIPPVLIWSCTTTEFFWLAKERKIRTRNKGINKRNILSPLFFKCSFRFQLEMASFTMMGKMFPLFS